MRRPFYYIGEGFGQGWIALDEIAHISKDDCYGEPCASIMMRSGGRIMIQDYEGIMRVFRAYVSNEPIDP